MLSKEEKRLLTDIRIELKRWQKELQKKDPDYWLVSMNLKAAVYHFEELLKIENIVTDWHKTSWENRDKLKEIIGAKKYDALANAESLMYEWRNDVIDFGNENAYTDDILRNIYKKIGFLMEVQEDE